MLKNLFLLLFTLIAFSSCRSIKSTGPRSEFVLPKNPQVAKNIVLMIVDGMGFQHVKAARIYNGQKLFAYENFPCKTKVTTCSYEGSDGFGHCVENTDKITDSAAAATAMATGVKVKNGVISKSIPNHRDDIETILELFKRQHKSTGIIATKLFSDATPAAFASHAGDRDNTRKILRDIFEKSQPNVVFGGDTMSHRRAAQKSKSQYQMVHTVGDLQELAEKIGNESSCIGIDCPHVYGGFGEHDMIPDVYKNKAGLPLEITPKNKFDELKVPHLSEMTDAALKILSKNEQGFFLMVESSMPDMISHYHLQIDHIKDGPNAVLVLAHEMMEVEKTIKVLESFVEKNPNTLVIITADHETGGLIVEEDQTTCLGEEKCIPKVRWTSEKILPTKQSAVAHTGVDVPLYATGMGAERFCQETINNTDIPHLALAE